MLANLLGETDKTKVEKHVYNKSGKISAQLFVNDSYRGTTAREISRLLANGSKKNEQEFYETMEVERKSFEKFLTDANFEVKDMGVAYATSLIVLWEMASHTELSQKNALKLGKFLVYSFSSMSEDYKNISEVEKAKAYDWLMTTPVVFASLIKGYEKQGRIKEAEILRKKTASIFAETFKLSHEHITVSKYGELGVNVKKIVSN